MDHAYSRGLGNKYTRVDHYGEETSWRTGVSGRRKQEATGGGAKIPDICSKVEMTRGNETKEIGMRSGQFHLKEHRSSQPPPLLPPPPFPFSMSGCESDDEGSTYESLVSGSEMDEDDGSLTPQAHPDSPLVDKPLIMDIDQVHVPTAVTPVAAQPNPQLEDQEIQTMETDNPPAASPRPGSPPAAPAIQTPRQLEYHAFISPNTGRGGDNVEESRVGKRRRRDSDSRPTLTAKCKAAEPLFLPEPESTLHKDQGDEKRASSQFVDPN